MRDTRLWLTAACVATVAVLAAGCGGGSDDAATATTTGAAATTTATPPPPPPPPPPSTATETTPEPKVETITIVVRGGVPVGGIARPSVKQGKKVRLVVRSDVADEVHVHGYDLMQDVAPGAPAKIVFVASIPGQFEVELEDRGLQLANLEVTP